MIHFFRRIRKTLLNDNKYRRYVLYAIGEIALVMIGILLALQINNWSEGRKIAANEAYILSEILNNLNEDAEQVKFILKRRRATQEAVIKLQDILNSQPLDENEIEENVALFLTFERYYPLNNSFEMMKSNGLVIENKSLRTAISRYYDFEQKKVAQSIKDIEDVIIRILQSENAIRSSLETGNVGTRITASIRIKDVTEPAFLELLRTELVNFNDNNAIGVERILAFEAYNNDLILIIREELGSNRLKKYL